MQRLMLVPCLVLLLAALACPVRAEAGEDPDSGPVDGIVDEEPPVVDPAPEPEPEPDQESDPPVIVLPVPTSFPLVTAAPDGEDFGGLDEDFFVDVDGIALPEDTVDYAALMEVLSSINLFLAYIVVGVLIVVGVHLGKLIYSFFNMFF